MYCHEMYHEYYSIIRKRSNGNKYILNLFILSSKKFRSSVKAIQEQNQLN
jgi:hypothetical protein